MLSSHYASPATLVRRRKQAFGTHRTALLPHGYRRLHGPTSAQRLMEAPPAHANRGRTRPAQTPLRLAHPARAHVPASHPRQPNGAAPSQQLSPTREAGETPTVYRGRGRKGRGGVCRASCSRGLLTPGPGPAWSPARSRRARTGRGAPPPGPAAAYPRPGAALSAHRDDVDEGGLARVLQPHQGELHLLLPEERAEPVQQPGEQRQHGGGGGGGPGSGSGFGSGGGCPTPARSHTARLAPAPRSYDRTKRGRPAGGPSAAAHRTAPCRHPPSSAPRGRTGGGGKAGRRRGRAARGGAGRGVCRQPSASAILGGGGCLLTHPRRRHLGREGVQALQGCLIRRPNSLLARRSGCRWPPGSSAALPALVPGPVPSFLLRPA